MLNTLQLGGLLRPIKRPSSSPPSVADVFAVNLYSGDGAASRTIATTVDLSGGGLWVVRPRAGTSVNRIGHAHAITSAGTVYRAPYGDVTTTAGATPPITFPTGQAAMTAATQNAASTTYAAWAFKRAARFLDVVTWTGDGTGSRAIPHALGIAPGLVSVHKLDTSNERWENYAQAYGPSSMQLWSQSGTFSAVNCWGGSSATDSVFYVGNTAVPSATSSHNVAGVPYVAVLFAHDPAADGVICVGLYTGNGSATGPTVNLGW